MFIESQCPKPIKVSGHVRMPKNGKHISTRVQVKAIEKKNQSNILMIQRGEENKGERADDSNLNAYTGAVMEQRTNKANNLTSHPGHAPSCRSSRLMRGLNFRRTFTL
jgi:hypothetical protein